MELCVECRNLDGRPSGLQSNAELTLVGVGEREGLVALEHYRCHTCGSLMVRQLCGETEERVWMALA